MKKIIAALLIFSVLSIQVFAVPTVDVEREEGVILVSGNTDPESQVTLLMLKDGMTKEDLQEITLTNFNDYVEYIDQTVSASDGYFSFKYGAQEQVSFQRFSVFLKEITENSQIEELKLVYFTSKSVDALAQKVIDCTTDTEVLKLLDNDSIALLELDTLFYNELAEEEQLEVLWQVANLTKGGVIDIQTVFYENSMLKAINSTKESNELTQLIELAKDKGIEEKVFGIKMDKDSRYTSLKDNQGLFLKNILKKTTFSSLEEYHNWCNLQLALTCVKCFKSTALESVLEEFEDYLEIDLSKLEGKNAEKVYTALAGKTFDDADEFSDAYDDAINGLSSSGSVQSGNSGGKGGSGFGGSYRPSVSVEEKEEGKTDAEKQEGLFTDVDKEHYAYSAIDNLSKKNIVSGYPDGSFCPDAKVTRAEFIKMITGALIENDGENPVPDFIDVSEKSWYKPFVERAVSNGIVKGISENEIGAEQEIKREELFTIIYRTCILKEIPLENKKEAEFTDSEDISEFAFEAVEKLASAGVINGFDGKVMPKDTATRGECAKILYEIMQLAEVGI